jgi:hypothetical protein
VRIYCVPNENYQKLPSSILSIKNRCTKHGNKYEFYCSIPCYPCCVMCTRDDHRHCQELRPILEVTENAKSSTAIVHIERDLKDIDTVFEKMKSRSKGSKESSSRIRTYFHVWCICS